MFGYPQVEFREAEGFNMQKLPSRVFFRKSALKICSKFTGEHPCRSVISIQLLCNFFEITLRDGCSPANLLHIFRTPLTRKTSERLLLNTPQVKDSEKEKDYAKLIFWKVSEFVFCVSIWFMWYVLESLRETIRKIHF